MMLLNQSAGTKNGKNVVALWVSFENSDDRVSSDLNVAMRKEV